jgi:hypothetical protein
MRGDDELRAGTRRAHNDRQQRERAADRQRRLGLVEDVEALAAEAVRGQGEERLAVGLRVQRDAAVDRKSGANSDPPSTNSAMLKKLSARRK